MSTTSILGLCESSAPAVEPLAKPRAVPSCPAGSLRIPLYGVDDWLHKHADGLRLTEKQINAATRFPAEDELDLPCPWNPGCVRGETHSTFLGIEGVSIADLPGIMNSEAAELCFEDYMDFRRKMRFTEEPLQFRWYSVLTYGVPASEFMTSDIQDRVVHKAGYKVPSATVLTAMYFLFSEKVTLLDSRWLRTATKLGQGGGFLSVGRTSRGIRQIGYGCHSKGIERVGAMKTYKVK